MKQGLIRLIDSCPYDGKVAYEKANKQKGGQAGGVCKRRNRSKIESQV